MHFVVRMASLAKNKNAIVCRRIPDVSAGSGCGFFHDPGGNPTDPAENSRIRRETFFGNPAGIRRVSLDPAANIFFKNLSLVKMLF